MCETEEETWGVTSEGGGSMSGEMEEAEVQESRKGMKDKKDTEQEGEGVRNGKKFVVIPSAGQ